MGGADFVVGLTVSDQIICTLVELPPCLTADAVHPQVVVDMINIQVCRHHNLEAWELTLSQLQPNGVGLLRCEGIRFSEESDTITGAGGCRGKAAERRIFGELHCWFPLGLRNSPRIRSGAALLLPPGGGTAGQRGIEEDHPCQAFKLNSDTQEMRIRKFRN